MMRIKVLIAGIIVFSLMLASCVSKKEISKSTNEIKKELSEDAEQQYYYVFIEANRKKLLGDLYGS